MTPTDPSHDAQPSAIAAGPLTRNKEFLKFLAARVGNMAGFDLLGVAVGWHIYDRTGSAMNLGLVGLFMFLPFLCLFLFAGIVADRVERRLVVGIASAIEAAAILGIGAVFWRGGDALWPIFALIALIGAGHAFVHPALQALLPSLVAREDFARAVAANTSISKAAKVGGPALGGLLIAWGDEVIYLLIASAFLVVSLAAFWLNPRKRPADRERMSLAVLLGGFSYIGRTPIVLGAMTIDLVVVLFGSVLGLLPIFAVDFLGVGVEGLGILRAMPALGAVLLGTVIVRLGMPRGAGKWFFVSLVVFGLSIGVVGTSTIFWISCTALVVYGAADMFSMNLRSVVVQLETPDALRGRVSAVNSVTVNASNQLGDFRAGLMAAFVGAPMAVMFGAGATLAFTALWWRLFPQLRALD